MPSDLVIVRPSQNGVRGELGAVVADDRAGLAAAFDQQTIGVASNPDAGDRAGCGNLHRTISGVSA